MTRRPPARRPSAHTPRKLSGLRPHLDAWFATIVRYCGLLVMADAIFLDHLAHIALVTAGMGMILFKSVWGGKDE